MLKNVKVENVYVNTQSKNGEAYINKKGRPYALVVIENEDGQKASMYADLEWHTNKIKQVQEMKGERVFLEFEKKGDFLNFDIPKKIDFVETKVKDLEKRVTKLEGNNLDAHTHDELDSESNKTKSEDVDPDELPF